MTKVGRLFEEEKIEYANKYANEKVQEKLNEQKIEIAKILLEENVDILIIMKVTGLSKAAILSLKDNPVKEQM